MDYKGKIGKQYNPDAVAQYGLGCYDIFLKTSDLSYKRKFLAQANWFVENLQRINAEVGLWQYNFDFEYQSRLKNPWHGALAQGHGLSILARAYEVTKDEIYLQTAQKAFESFRRPVTAPGGVMLVDNHDYIWFEEAIVEPPTHVLNGFISALWGVYDYYLTSRDKEALRLYKEGVRTLGDYLPLYDIGFWSVYHLVNTRIKMIASSYYHNLHILQLKVMYSLTGNEIFLSYSQKWKNYYSKRRYRIIALLWKIAFKVLYY